MKIGLDSNKKDFSQRVVMSFRDKQDFLINMETKKYKNEGDYLYRLAMGVNSSRVDLFIGVYIDKGATNDITVFYDESYLGKIATDCAYEKLRERLGAESVKLRSGERFYLLNRIEAPAFLILGTLTEDTSIEKSFYTIIKEIFSMEN